MIKILLIASAILMVAALPQKAVAEQATLDHGLIKRFPFSAAI